MLHDIPWEIPPLPSTRLETSYRNFINNVSAINATTLIPNNFYINTDTATTFNLAFYDHSIVHM